MDREELAGKVREQTRLMSTPINFDALIQDGILERHGDRYRILDNARVPEHVSAQIRTVTQREDGAVLVTFQRAGKRARE